MLKTIARVGSESKDGSEAKSPPEKISYSELQWKCRRGTKELDYILTQFLESEYSTLSDKDILSLYHLLDYQDPDLSRYLLESQSVTGSVPGSTLNSDPNSHTIWSTPPEFESLIQRIRAAVTA